MPRARHIISTCLAAALSLGVAAGAVAQEDAEKKEEGPQYDPYEEFVRANRLVSYGGYSRAVKHYERALRGDPVSYDIAHFNLGEVWRARDKCDEAAFHYQAYLQIGRDEEALELSREGLEQCIKKDWGTLALQIEGAEGVPAIHINGFVFTRGTKLEPIKLPPGSYEIEVEATDYIPASRTLELDREQNLEQAIELERELFFGSVSVEVDQKGATVKLIPKELDKSSSEIDPVVKTSPVQGAVKLPTGKYLLEVTHEDHDRWIRHVYVTRDNESSVRVRMTRSLPPELR